MPAPVRSLPLLFVAALTLGACSVEGPEVGAPPTTGGPGPVPTLPGPPSTTGSTTTSEPAPTTTVPAPEPGEVDPCEVVDRETAGEVLGGEVVIMDRGLMGDDGRFDSCWIGVSENPDSIEVGLLAVADPPPFDELVEPHLEGTPPIDAGVGDESFSFRDLSVGDHLFVLDGERILYVRTRHDGAVDPTAVADLAEDVLDELPERLPEGGLVLDGRCSDISLGRVEALVGRVQLARGSDVRGEGIRCGFLGTEDRWVSVSSSPGGAALVKQLLGLGSRWVASDVATSAAVSNDGRSMAAASPLDRGVMVWTYAVGQRPVDPTAPAVAPPAALGQLTRDAMVVVDG